MLKDEFNNENREHEAPEYDFKTERRASFEENSQNDWTGQNKEPKRKRKVLTVFAKCVAFAAIVCVCFLGTRFFFEGLEGEHKVQENSTVKEKTILDVEEPEVNVKEVATTKLTPVTMISEETVSLVAKNTMPSIVSIQSTSNEQYIWYGREFSDESVSSGSGFIVGENEDELFIATNNHVVEGAIKIEVTFIDGSVGEAVIKGTDSIADLAVISVDLKTLSKETKKEIKVATLGNSDEAKVGELVIAIGNALGYGQSVTVGYVSAKNRNVDVSSSTTHKKMVFLQTDAAINPGNSGGALLNANGEVIGINTVKYSSTEVEGMGYAIPITKAIPIINELKNREILSEEEQGYLGISGRSVTEDIAEYYGFPIGVYIAEVSADGSAEKAGIQVGDVITAVNDIEISDITQLKEKVNSIRVGEKVSITYQRAMDGEYVETTVEVTLMKNPNL